MADEQIRKEVYSLSSQDFQDHPIWEFCLDEEDVEGQDEATVRPSEDLEVPGYFPGAYVVAADVTCGGGTRAEGYLYSGLPDDIGCVQRTLCYLPVKSNFGLVACSTHSNGMSR